jgi:dipeptidyl aminopeptidase/acylaminoacyl peptidase
MKSRGWTMASLVTVAVLVAALAASVRPALAAFPGKNGKIVFASMRDNIPGEIYTMNADGSNQARLTNNSVYDDTPVWSPDMTKIAFVRAVGATADIFVMNADGTNQVNLTAHAATDTYPAWSPDGSKIVFSSDRDTAEGLYELYTVNAADGGNVTRLTNNASYDDTADWSPDGTKIAFQSYRDGNFEVYVMNADGSNQRNCTNNPSSDGIPSWSPDGTKVAFYSERDGNQEVYVMNADCTNPRNISNDPGQDYYAVWSPDGTKITFTTERLGPGEVFVMDADGTNQVNITNHPDWDRNPDWGSQVPAWRLSGFYSPVDMPTPTDLIFNSVKGGNTVPLKFEVFAAEEELTDTAVVKSLTYAGISCDASAPTDEIETLVSGGTSLRYDTTAGQFVYNWKTPKRTGCLRLTLTTQDDSSLVAYFKLR